MREENEIANIAAQMRHADERREIHARLCARHRLVPAATSAAMLAKAEMAYASGWRSFVVSRCASSAQACNILDPASSRGDKATIDNLLATQARLWREFEVAWPPADFSATLQHGDGTTSLHAHNLGIRAA